MEDDRSLQALMARVVHELRSPLAVMNGYLSMIMDGTFPAPEETRDGPIRTLVTKAQEMNMLVETLATSGRGVAPGQPPGRERLDAHSAVRQAVARIEERARLEGAQVEVVAGERPEPVVLANERDVVCILTNLLSNALSYSQRPPSVLVQVRPGDPVEVAVHDHGSGIPFDRQKEVFGPLVRASRTVPGLGIGLSVSRELAERNGGSLVLEWSQPGRGSVFVLRLPAAGARRDAAGAA
jgi:signal transduction histidine kinase